MKFAAIILTFNEQKHLQRCIDSLKGVVDEVVVVDCFSTDATLEIAKANGARILQKVWVNYATQFNWALTQLGLDVDWVLRIDADEVLTDPLRQEIKQKLPLLSNDIKGVYCDRRMIFIGQSIKYGGVFPIRVLRIFRLGQGECENRWMDEHIKVTGLTADFKGELIDDNLNSLTWWTEKHNKYASREAIDLLNLEYGFMKYDSVAQLTGASRAGFKRWLKEKVYAKLPVGLRAFAYFVYRYVVRLGFLDGRAGAQFHFLQGFWYRFLVDAKVDEVKRYMANNNVDIKTAIKEVLSVGLS
jgi:glycosyltransferase involved in cell wall biosynthesis